MQSKTDSFMEALTAERDALIDLLKEVDSRGLPDRYNSDAELQRKVTATLKGGSANG